MLCFKSVCVTNVSTDDSVGGRHHLGEVSVAGYGDRLDESDEDYIAAVNTMPGPCLCVCLCSIACKTRCT